MQAHAYPALDRASRLSLIGLAVLQAILLLALHQAIVHDVWPATDPRWLLGTYAVVVGVPLFLYLGAAEARDRANFFAIAVGLVLFGLGWHAGWVAGSRLSPAVRPSVAAEGYRLFLHAALALFIAAFLFRTWRESGGRGLPYSRLVDTSWLNALTLAFLLLFVGVFWLILVLWSGLFRILGIDFFSELFSEAAFIYPVTGLVAGFGLVVIRDRLPLIATVRGLCEALIRALLPLTAFVAVIFLGTLPFTSLAPLWNTRSGTALVTMLVIVMLFFFNAELGSDQAQRQRFAPLRWLVTVALVVLPAAVAIAGWGLSQRVLQHGWTVDRLLALFVIGMLGAYAFGYAMMILYRRGIPHAALGRWNTVLAVVLVALLVLVISPVLDFKRIAAAHQLVRLERGAVESAQFDVWYLTGLGRYGTQALETLQSSAVAERDPELLRRVERALAGARREPLQPQVMSHRIEPAPGSSPPAELTTLLSEQDVLGAVCRQQEMTCRLAPLDYESERWWLLYVTAERDSQDHLVRIASSPFFKQSADGGWLLIGTLSPAAQCLDEWASERLPQAPVLLTAPALFVRIGRCAYQLLFQLEPQPVSSG